MRCISIDLPSPPECRYRLRCPSQAAWSSSNHCQDRQRLPFTETSSVSSEARFLLLRPRAKRCSVSMLTPILAYTYPLVKITGLASWPVANSLKILLNCRKRRTRRVPQKGRDALFIALQRFSEEKAFLSLPIISPPLCGTFVSYFDFFARKRPRASLRAVIGVRTGAVTGAGRCAPFAIFAVLVACW